ncbi:hypothetical protein N2152v2_005994 [Parachlorella kessleri]
MTSSDDEEQSLDPNCLPKHITPSDVPALFWDELPEDDDNPDMAAIKAIIEESTPEERALNFKDQGNKALQTGLQHKKKFYLREAIDKYSEGLALQCGDAELNSVLNSNRAHVNLLLGNFRNALLDGLAAAKANPSNVKAYYRAAKAALGLRKYDQCEELCSKGLALDPANKELQKYREQAGAERRRNAEREAAEAARQERLRGPAGQLAQALLSRGWRVGRPQFKIGDRRPYLDTSGLVHWPALFFYPEASMSSDTLEDFCEKDTFRDHLDVMFGPEAPPLDWDKQRLYSRENVELYYLSHSASPLSRENIVEVLHGGWPEVEEQGPARYGAKAAGWVRVKEQWTLADALGRPDHVVPGIPVFFVLARGSPFRQQFLDNDVPLL